MAAETKYVITAEDRTRAAIRSAIDGLTDLKGAASGIASRLSSLGGMGGLLGVLGGAGIAATLKASVDAMDQMDESAGRLGLRAEALSALAYASKMSGVEFDELTAALAKLSGKMQDVASGNKAAVALFADLGVSVIDSSGKLKSADLVFADIAARFAEFEDGAAKTALAADLFGKSGARLVPLLNAGADGLAAMTEEARALGAVVDDEAAAAAATFNDNLDRLGTLSSSVARVLVGELLPSINSVAERFLAGAKGAGGFSGGISMLLDGTGSAGEQLIKLRRELDDLTAARARYLKSNAPTDSIDTAIATLERKIKAYEALQRAEAPPTPPPPGSGESPAGAKKTIRRTLVEDEKSAPAARAAPAYTDPLADEAQAYQKAMLQLTAAQRDADMAGLALTSTQQRLLEVMSAPEWLTMTEAMRVQIAAQGEATIAAEARTKAEQRLQALLTDADLERQRADMQLLAQAYEDGKISVEQFVDAAQRRIGSVDTTPAVDQFARLDMTISNAFQGAGDALADFVTTGKLSFGGLVDSMVRDLIRLEAQTQLSGLWKSMGGLSGIASAVGSYFSTWAQGGVFENSPSLSAFSGGVYDSPQVFAFARGAGVFGEAGPEAIMPLKRSADGKLGVAASGGGATVEVHIHESSSRAGQVSSTQGAGGKTLIDVFVERVKGAMAADVASGGPFAGAIEAQYGLNRAAGAWR